MDRWHSRYSRREFLGWAAAGTAGLMASGLARSPLAGAFSRPADAGGFDSEVPRTWFDLSMALVRETPGFSPPVASRAFAYTGITLYESLVPTMDGYRSLSGQLAGLAPLPQQGRNAAYHPPLVANAALATILRALFPTAPEARRAAVDALERSFEDRFRPEVPAGVFTRSVERGRDVAGAVFRWSKDDGGHDGYLRNFPPDYVPPAGPGMWQPTPPAFQRALQPTWGDNRTCAVSSGSDCPPGDPTPYSEDEGSVFHAEALEVYASVNGLTVEQEEIARFWSDDPGATATPPGHSISILSQVLGARDEPLDVAAEAYAKVGMAVGDAFVCCWNAKYRYNVLRPVTYVQLHIDPTWTPLLPTPPFPEYSSGHSVQSGAAFQVMTDLFGDVAFTDHTHDPRGFAARSFGSFAEAGEEAAISRLYGGIHFRPAIEKGLEQGRCIGRAVSALRVRA